MYIRSYKKCTFLLEDIDNELINFSFKEKFLIIDRFNNKEIIKRPLSPPRDKNILQFSKIIWFYDKSLNNEESKEVLCNRELFLWG